MVIAAVLTVVLTVLAPGAEALRAQGEVEIEATVGIGGYVDPTLPVSVRVTLRSPVLFGGSIELRQGGSTVVRPVEVPAGGAKTYTIVTPPPVIGQPARVRVYEEGNDRAVATETLQIRAPEDRVLVGLVAAPGVRATLTDLRSEVGGFAIEPIDLDTVERGLRPLAYLVVGDSDRVGGEVARWVEGGGRLIGITGSADRLGLEMLPAGTGPDGAGVWFKAGKGEVIEYPDLEEVGDWARVLRPVPMILGPREAWQTPDRALANAASNGGQTRTPSLPWLLAAIIGYAAVVGPVNLIVLGRLHRRDLAWLTVPVLSLLAVVGFWLAGRSRLETEVFSHASVLVAGSDGQGRSAVAMATGKAGSRLLTFPPDWEAYPGQLGDFADSFGVPVAKVAGEAGDDGIRFDLPRLGFAAVQAFYSPEQLPVVRMRLDGTDATFAVENSTDLGFWAWGVASPVGTKVAPGTLTGGAADTLSVRIGGNAVEFGLNVGDAVVQARRLWEDERGWQVLYPLGEAAGYMRDLDLFFFGYTDDYVVPVSVDGRSREVTGSTLVIVPIPTTDRVVAELGRARGRLVATGEAGWIERGPGFFFVATDELLVSFQVPWEVDVDPTLAFNNVMGERPERFEAWDWVDRAFVPVSVGDRLPRDRFVAADGEVFIRAGASDTVGQEAFAEIPMAPSSIELRWESA